MFQRPQEEGALRPGPGGHGNSVSVNINLHFKHTAALHLRKTAHDYLGAKTFVFLLMSNYYKWHGCQILTPCEVTAGYKTQRAVTTGQNSARTGSGQNSLLCFGRCVKRNAWITAAFHACLHPRPHSHPCSSRTVPCYRTRADPVRAVYLGEAERMSGCSIRLQGADERAWMRLLHDLRAPRRRQVRGLHGALRHGNALHTESRRPAPAPLAHSRTGRVHHGPRRTRCVSSLYRRVADSRSDAKR